MASRSSVRLAEKWKLEEVPTLTSSSSSGKKPRPVAKPPQKKKKTTAREVSKNVVSVPRQDDFRKIKGRKGQLKIMTELPLDVLMEIFGHLHPLDLLNLSKATKDLRAMLTAKSAGYLWKDAYAALQVIDSVGNAHGPNLPPCPLNVNILHYTNIIFGQDCDFCPSRKAKIVHYGVLVRMCNKCAPQELALANNRCLGPLENIAVSISAPQMFSTTVLERRCFYYLRKEYDSHVRSLNECDGEARASYITTAQEKQSRRTYDLTMGLSRWVGHQKRRENSAMYNIRLQRHKAITAKLIEEGYGTEVATRWYRVEFMPGANVSAPLTDKAWNKIKAKIIGVYEWQRQEERKRSFVNAYSRRMHHLRILVNNSESPNPKPWIYAPVPYVAQSQPFAQIFKQVKEKSRWDDPEEKIINEQLDAQAHLIPGISLKWREEADAFLLSLLSETHDTKMQIDSDKTPLSLATTFFNCNCNCAEPITYPRILVHSCLRNTKIPDKDDDTAPSNDETPPDDDNDNDNDEAESDEDQEEEDDDTPSANPSEPLEVYGIPSVTLEKVWDKMSSWCSVAWDQSAISIDEEAVGFSKVVIRACGEDPDTVTSPAMDARTNLRVECTRCTNSKAVTRLVMTWRAAILHDIESHFEDPPSETGWKLITEAKDLERIVVQEKKIPQKRATSLSNKYCAHCDRRVSPNDIDALRQHLSECHKIQEEDSAKLEKHIYVALDTHMKTFPCPVKI